MPPRRRKRVDKNKSSNEEKPLAATASNPLHQPIIEPAESDYILGRGLAHVTHPGNALLHDTLDKALPKYNAAKTKLAKMKIVREIHDRLSVKGRFIRKAKGSNRYYVVDAVTAREKISHGIRYRRRRQESDSPETQPSDQAAPPSPMEQSREENTEAQVPSFSLGSSSVHSHASSWPSGSSSGNRQAARQVEIVGIDLDDEGSIGSGLFSVQSLQRIMEAGVSSLSSPRFPSSPSSSLGE